jgi:hypothetical protein
MKDTEIKYLQNKTKAWMKANPADAQEARDNMKSYIETGSCNVIAFAWFVLFMEVIAYPEPAQRKEAAEIILKALGG